MSMNVNPGGEQSDSEEGLSDHELHDQAGGKDSGYRYVGTG